MGGLAVGFFDGVHLGHQAILHHASVALTFRNHPLTVVDPARAPRLIMPPEERLAAIRACGVDDVRMLDFTPEMAGSSPVDFLRTYILSEPVIREGGRVLCGSNWRFGRHGAGDAEFLSRQGVGIEVVPYAVHRGERISSSRIRSCLERGDIGDANAMLGRRFRLHGVAEHGKGLGARIGFPTVNLRLRMPGIRLPLGVYEVEANGTRGIANYGLAPTMGDAAWQTPTLEIHFLPTCPPALAAGARATAPLPVDFLRFLRPERRFPSLDALKAQIALDCGKISS